MTTNFKFEIIEHIATLSTSDTGWTLELNIVSFNDNPPKYDVRQWSPNHKTMSKGFQLTQDELKLLAEAYEERNAQ